MKKYFILILSFIFIIIMPIISLSATYNAYASVTENTSQISILLSTMYNQHDFSQYMNFVALRTGDQDYSVFYNISDNNSCKRIRYYGTQSGYSTIWHLEKTDETNFNYFTNNYTVVGNTANTLGSSSYREYQNYSILKYSIPLIVIILLFSLFHIRHRFKKSAGGINL